MKKFSSSPAAMLATSWSSRGLIFALAKREVMGRYRGSIMGLCWSLITPMVMLAIYTFVFSVVFRARWGGGGDSKTEFALMLFAGLIVFNLFSECYGKSPSVILGNVNYVKKVVFPLEILPVVNLLAAIFHCAVSLIVWLVAFICLFGVPHLTVLMAPVIVLPLSFFILGLSWFLASLGVYVRDVNQVIAISTTVLMFLSPIFYPSTALPEKFQSLMLINPLTLPIEQMRSILFAGVMPDLYVLAGYYLFGMAVACFGFAWFQKTRKGFADVI